MNDDDDDELKQEQESCANGTGPWCLTRNNNIATLKNFNTNQSALKNIAMVGSWSSDW
jgi:hypothetical protein